MSTMTLAGKAANQLTGLTPGPYFIDGYFDAIRLAGYMSL